VATVKKINIIIVHDIISLTLFILVFVRIVIVDSPFFQETARKHKGWSLDAMSMDCDVMRCFMDDIKVPPLEGVYVHGLTLDNAAWDIRNSRIIDDQQQVGIMIA